jgi:hypothetical protein
MSVRLHATVSERFDERVRCVEECRDQVNVCFFRRSWDAGRAAARSTDPGGCGGSGDAERVNDLIASGEHARLEIVAGPPADEAELRRAFQE